MTASSTECEQAGSAHVKPYGFLDGTADEPSAQRLIAARESCLGPAEPGPSRMVEVHHRRLEVGST
jgi:hypothetical protein